MNNIKKNMFMLTGAWGTGRNLKLENRFSGDYYKDERWPKANGMYYHPDNCYNAWPNIIANNINANIHWVGSDNNHTTNSLSSLEYIWKQNSGQWGNDVINYYFVVLNGTYDLQESGFINEKNNFWENYEKVSNFYKKSLKQFILCWDNLQEIVANTTYNDRLVFFVQDREKIDKEFIHTVHSDTLSIQNRFETIADEHEYTYFCRISLDSFVEAKWLRKSRYLATYKPFDGETLDARQQEALGLNVYSWLTNNTNCFIM